MRVPWARHGHGPDDLLGEQAGEGLGDRILASQRQGHAEGSCVLLAASPLVGVGLPDVAAKLVALAEGLRNLHATMGCADVDGQAHFQPAVGDRQRTAALLQRAVVRDQARQLADLAEVVLRVQQPPHRAHELRADAVAPLGGVRARRARIRTLRCVQRNNERTFHNLARQSTDQLPGGLASHLDLASHSGDRQLHGVTALGRPLAVGRIHPFAPLRQHLQLEPLALLLLLLSCCLDGLLQLTFIDINTRLHAFPRAIDERIQTAVVA
mmetsp:Transcript_52489/g.135473  ORF Transcript_52489/g.135473 Transcript_52489/m.135473 type:complete len:268 (-) Transcript_52489:437-1240(-)